MEDKVQVFIFASPEVRKVLSDSRVDLAEVLVREHPIEPCFTQNPVTKGSGTKDLTVAILATTAITFALSSTLTRILSILTNRRVVVKELELAPVIGPKGTVVRDEDGQPVLYWAHRTRVVSEPRSRTAETNAMVKGPFGIEISFTDKIKD